MDTGTAAGQLEPGTLPAVLKQIHDAGQSGELLCTYNTGRRSFFVDGKNIVGFQSNYPEDDLANFLFQQNILTKDEYDVLISRALEGRNTDDLIIHSEIIEEEVLRQQQTVRVERALLECNAWTSGQYEFTASLLVSFLQAMLSVPLLSCVVCLLRQEYPEEVLLARIGGLETVLSPSSNWQQAASEIRLTPQEGFVLSRISTPMTVREILEVVPLPRQQVLPILQMLLVLGLTAHGTSKRETVPPQPIPATPGVKVPPPAVERIESPAIESESLNALGERISAMVRDYQHASHYQVLGVEENVTSDDIKSAYHQLARQYHPDRFYSDSVSPELRRSVEELFEKIRTAYETLRDNKSRAEYDRGRASAKPAAASSAGPAEDTERMAEYCYKQGRQFYQDRDFFRAVQQFKEAVRLQPNIAKYRHGLAKAMMRNPRWRKEAEENFKKAIELDEFNADYRVELGLLYLDANMPRKAEAAFEDALTWDAENRIALKELTKLRESQKQPSILTKLFGGKKKKL